ncbi:MAG: c-type cytochrome [Bacteroidota bacterium]
MKVTVLGGLCVLLLGVVLTARVQDHHVSKNVSSAAAGLLIPASATMVTAWDVPRNPMSDSLLNGHPLVEQIRWGFRLFTNTPHEAPTVSANKLSCNNCHLNAGQKEKAMPLVGIATVYPEYNKRAGRLFSLEDRIVGCFMRSQNATGLLHMGQAEGGVPEASLPSTESREVLALAAYLSWLSEGFPIGKELPWRGHNVIAANKLIPLDKLDPRRGEVLFIEKCSSCHGEDGQGMEIGDKKAGPLWGPDSWNDGAGAARVYTLAGMIRYSMPYLDPSSLTDEEAQHIAAFINSKSRPQFPFKEGDYRTERIPIDAVYYKR